MSAEQKDWPKTIAFVGGIVSAIVGAAISKPSSAIQAMQISGACGAVGWLVTYAIAGAAFLICGAGSNRKTEIETKAKEMLDSASKSLEELVASLRSDLSEKESRVRSGSSPLQPNTIEERKRALNDLAQSIENTKNVGVKERANKLQEVLPSYHRLSIDMSMDTVDEFEHYVKKPEAAKIRKGTTATEDSIKELRANTATARSSLQTARQALPEVATNSLAITEQSIKAGLTVVNALRLTGDI
jgi:hypothetical protein